MGSLSGATIREDILFLWIKEFPPYCLAEDFSLEVCALDKNVGDDLSICCVMLDFGSTKSQLICISARQIASIPNC